MSNAYSDKRREALLELLDPTQPDGETVDSLVDFVDREVNSAFRRGVRYGQNGGVVTDRSRRTTNGKALPYSSAVQAGVLPRA